MQGVVQRGVEGQGKGIPRLCSCPCWGGGQGKAKVMQPKQADGVPTHVQALAMGCKRSSSAEGATRLRQQSVVA
jgi:hypothetical protein